jgi:hypothetical protein
LTISSVWKKRKEILVHLKKLFMKDLQNPFDEAVYSEPVCQFSVHHFDGSYTSNMKSSNRIIRPIIQCCLLHQSQVLND